MISDLSDERRSAKDWLPADDRDVSNGLVVAGWMGKPRCIRHGMMSRVSSLDVEPIYRCGEFRCGVGARYSPTQVETITLSNLQGEKVGYRYAAE